MKPALSTMPDDDLFEKKLREKILELKHEKNAIILAHYYQVPAIQDIADHVGDSLDLSRKTSQTEADIILFAGVHFMAETAKVLNPDKKVIIPDLEASCSLAESCPPEVFNEFIQNYPNHIVVSYINCSAAIKAKSDYICTSSNAVQVINSIPVDKEIVFLPDKNLGNYLIKQTGRDMVLWNGVCSVHEAFSMEKILKLHQDHPKAKFIAHPECNPRVLEVAEFVGSTAALLRFVKEDTGNEYIVGTEHGILHEMQKKVPEKILIPAPVVDDESCACSECEFMKMNTLSKLYIALKNEFPEITLPDTIRKKAEKPIREMIAV